MRVVWRREMEGEGGRGEGGDGGGGREGGGRKEREKQ